MFVSSDSKHPKRILVPKVSAISPLYWCRICKFVLVDLKSFWVDLPDLTFLNPEQYGNFSPLIQDYLAQNPELKPLYAGFPTPDSLQESADEKLNEYVHREVVASVLKRQMGGLDLSEKQKENLEKFTLPETVTITTGHQLNLLTGPLYFFYKILQTLKCCEEMNRISTPHHFVPVFWMATEDHDFEEINHFYFKNQKFTWNQKVSGPVGKLKLEGIEEVFRDFLGPLPDTRNAGALRELIEHAYLNSATLTEATQKIVQSLFGEYGLLMIDGNDKELKELMIPAFRDELLNRTAFQKVSETSQFLAEKAYPIQVNPREINLFYLGDGDIRERIVCENEMYYVLNSSYKFTQEEIMGELNSFPEKFSPNVLLRPLYQETVLPNLAYIGGSGEIAYWLQLKDYFESRKVLFPLLIVRNSVLILNPKQKSGLEKLGIAFQDLFKPLHELIRENVMQNCVVDIDFDVYENRIHRIFDELTERSAETDATFANMVSAQKAKQLKGMQKMKQRFVKAERRKQSERVERMELLYRDIFPKGNLQERVVNFSEIWLGYGPGFVKEIYNEIHPCEFRFIIKTLP